MDPRTQLGDLKKAISISEREIQELRGKLSLTSTKPTRVWYVIPVVVFVSLLWLLPRASISYDFTTIQNMLEDSSGHQKLEKWALGSLKSENQVLAKLVLASTQDGETGWQFAVQGLEQSREPELRFAFLEILLERFDEQPYQVDWVDDLIEKEQNLFCLALLSDLLFLAEINS